MSMPSTSATLAASTKSWRDEQYSSSSSSQFFMKMPTTSWPARCRSHAVTAESTPPERPTTMRCGREAVMGRTKKARSRMVESAVRSRFLQYAAVGAVATAAHYAILVGLVEAGWLAPQRAAALGAWVGAQVAFAGNAAFTFRGAPVTLASWLRFQVTALVGAALSFALVAAGTRLGIHYLLAQIVATLITLVVTFEINRRWSFAPST